MQEKRSVLRRVLDCINQVSSKFAGDHLSAYAAQVTFYLLLAFFPFTMLICMATRLLPIGEETLLNAVRMLLPKDYQTLGTDLIDGYYNEDIGSAKLFLIVFLIWTASRLIHALMNGFNTVYGIQENRSQTILRLIGCLYTIALCGLLIALAAMYALGSEAVAFLVSKAPDQHFLDTIFHFTRNLASPLLMFLVFWLAYRILPSRKTKFRYEIPGALLTAGFWRVMALAYGTFLGRSVERYSYVYGSLSGVVMLLVWLYTCVYVWFVGGELNWYLQKRRAEGKRFIPNPFPLIKRVFRLIRRS